MAARQGFGRIVHNVRHQMCRHTIDRLGLGFDMLEVMSTALCAPAYFSFGEIAHPVQMSAMLKI